MSEKSRKTIQQLEQEIDKILDWLEGDDFEVEVAIQKYENVKKLAKELAQKLDEAENKINIISSQEK